jgi:hypothetical protein
VTTPVVSVPAAAVTAGRVVVVVVGGSVVVVVVGGGTVVGTGAATVVGTGAAVVDVVWAVAWPCGPPDPDEDVCASTAEVSFHEVAVPLARATDPEPAAWLPAVVDADAAEPLWINRSGTISTAPHRRSATPGRLPFFSLVLRTPLSLWDEVS